MVSLWQRWWPGKVCLELLDDKIQNGYREQEHDQNACADSWLDAWSDVLRLCGATGIGSIKDFDDRFPMTQSLYNWSQYLEDALRSAGPDSREMLASGTGTRSRTGCRSSARRRVSSKRSALDALSADEKAAVLDELLTGRPDLREPAEAYAARLMKDADRSAVADDVGGALQYLGIDELNGRAGYRPGFGYVDPAEAAGEILDEALQPFLDDLQRRAGLGIGSAATEVAAGILLGLYNCRDGSSETLLEYAPDYAAERASAVLSDCTRVGIELPAELVDLMPRWSNLLA